MFLKYKFFVRYVINFSFICSLSFNSLNSSGWFLFFFFCILNCDELLPVLLTSFSSFMS